MYVIKLGTAETFPAYLKDLSLSQTLAKVMRSTAFQFNFRDRSTKELNACCYSVLSISSQLSACFFFFSFLFTKLHLHQCKRINKETEKLGRQLVCFSIAKHVSGIISLFPIIP